jgi:uncharacterized protein YbjT (DUF2867 family)
MPRSEAIILVTGATGQQGGAAARRLLADGWRVRALTRDPASPAAVAMRRAGAEIVAGDMDDRRSLYEALRGVYGVFSVQPAGLDLRFGPDDEVRLGKNLADAAKAAGVRHFVYSSVGGADRQPAVPHFESKWVIEQHVQASGLPFTILRPVSFMELLLSPFVGLENGTLSFLLHPDTSMQWIAVDDIGAFVALAFGQFDDFAGKALELAGDAFTMAEAAEAISAATGHPTRYLPLPQGIIEANPLLLSIQTFGETKGFAADIPALRQVHPGLLGLQGWLGKTGKRLLEARLAANASRAATS